jgi:hypothetical protein
LLYRHAIHGQNDEAANGLPAEFKASRYGAVEVTKLRAYGGLPHQIQHDQYDAHKQRNLNENGIFVNCEKSQQPENNRNRGDYPKHDFISLLPSAGTI